MPKRKPANKTIEVILLQPYKGLGEKFEVVKVAPVFARNMLLGNGSAVLASEGNKHNYQKKMEAANKEAAKRVAHLEDLFKKLDDSEGITISKKVNDQGSLYEKVDADDIINTIESEYKITLDSHHIKLKGKITALGDYEVPYLYKNMVKTISLKVVAAEEAAPKAKKEKAEKTEEAAAE